MARSNAGRPQITDRVKSGPGYELADWLNRNLDRLTDKTNEEIATELGYTRPNIISMWRTGRTRIALERLRPLSKILGVDMVTLLPMWLEQYIDREGYEEIKKAGKRIVSEDEAEIIDIVRAAHDHGPISSEFKMRLKNIIPQIVIND